MLDGGACFRQGRRTSKRFLPGTPTSAVLPSCILQHDKTISLTTRTLTLLTTLLG